MQNTVIGVYDNYSQAKAAFNELVALGYSMSNIQLSPEQEGHEARAQALSYQEDERDEKEEGFSLGKIFRSLFGHDEDHGHHHAYHEAVRRGSYLVTVQAESSDLREQACQVLERFDPVDIDERSSQWRTQGWSRYERGSSVLTDEEVQRDRAMYRNPVATGSALDQRVKVYGVDPNLANTPNTVAASGATPVGRMADSDMDDFRHHWQDSYSNLGGRYEDYEPAYRFGTESRKNELYRGRNWNEIEPELQRDWEGRHADTPWERAKEAVRHAWDKIPG